MADSDDHDHKHIVTYLVNDPVIADAHAIEVVAGLQLTNTARARVECQGVNSPSYSLPHISRQCIQFFPRLRVEMNAALLSEPVILLNVFPRDEFTRLIEALLRFFDIGAIFEGFKERKVFDWNESRLGMTIPLKDDAFFIAAHTPNQIIKSITCVGCIERDHAGCS